MMMKTTPFHATAQRAQPDRPLRPLGGLPLGAALRPRPPKHEYFAVRNSAGFFDTSPLYKYRITGPDAERFLAGVMTRDVRRCRPGQAMYTVWCDDAGYVLEDGVVFRHAEDDWLLTAADPNLGYLEEPGRPAAGLDRGRQRRLRHARRPGAALARDPGRARARGRATWPSSGSRPPRSAAPRSRSRAPATPATSASRCASRPTTRSACSTRSSRPATGHGFRPFGEDALMMLRIEAGLSLINVEFSSARYAFTDAERFTPKELGFGWMLGKGGVRARRGPAVHRPPRDRARAARRHLALGDGRAVGRLAGVRPGSTSSAACSCPRTRTRSPWESMLYGGAGPRRARRLRHQPHVLPRAPAPHRDGPRAAGVRREGLDGAPGDHRRPRVPLRAGHDRPAAALQPRAQDELDGSRARPDLEPNGALMADRQQLRRDRRRRRPQRPHQRGYLAKSGLNVLVLERRGFVGGAAITEELHPGFSFTTFSYALSLLRPEIIHELDLVKHGFMPLLMPTSLLADGRRRLPAAAPRTSSSTTRRSAGTASATSTATTAGATTSTRSSSWPSRCSTTRRPTSSATTRTTRPTSPG